MTVVLLREPSRLQLLCMFLRANTGHHLELPFVEVFRCTELVVLPAEGSQGVITADGDLMPMCETHIKVAPKAAKICTQKQRPRTLEAG